MALRLSSSSSPCIHFHNSNKLSARSSLVHVLNSCGNTACIKELTIGQRFLKPCSLSESLKSLIKPTSAVGTGLEASVTGHSKVNICEKCQDSSGVSRG
ncbi:uncharacterized protein LOC141659557 isoform X2 [Apium graveolens]|uniref:uncharacterized protein LOC141659557 isoform X2 n=1 Tax=Apium graveolens TaxID=4045 RepID=UPI003D79106C